MQRSHGRTIPISRYIEQGWREEKCASCGGRGIGYAHRNGDPRMPIVGHEYCKACSGRGSTWTSPGGRRCSYPGGPWLAG